MCKNDLKWTNLYKNKDFSNQFCMFRDLLLKTKANYETYSAEKIKKIGHVYYEFWLSVIELYKYFLWNNAAYADNAQEVVKRLIYTDIFDDGSTFYKLYRGMKNLKKNNYLIPKKYFGDKYINQFVEIYNFFEERRKLEAEYEMVS